MVFSCSIVLLLVGLIEPFKLPMNHKLELLNESLVLISFYYMIIYSEFVPDVNARYLVAWFNILLVAMMILINIGFSTFGSLKRPI